MRMINRIRVFLMYLIFLNVLVSFSAIAVFANMDEAVAKYGALYKKGCDFQAKGKFDLAISCYDKVISKHSKNTAVYIRRGFCNQQLQKYDLAIKDYSKAIKFFPKQPWAYGYRAGCYRMMGKFDKAIDDYEEFLRHADTPVHDDFGQVDANDVKNYKGWMEGAIQDKQNAKNNTAQSAQNSDSSGAPDIIPQGSSSNYSAKSSSDPCAGRRYGINIPAHTNQADKVAISWINYRSSDLIAKCGPASRTSPDGKGGTIYIYEGAYSQDSYRHVPVIGSDGSYLGGWNVTDTYTYKTEIDYYTDECGVIYSWRTVGFTE